MLRGLPSWQKLEPIPCLSHVGIEALWRTDLPELETITVDSKSRLQVYFFFFFCFKLGYSCFQVYS